MICNLHTFAPAFRFYFTMTNKTSSSTFLVVLSFATVYVVWGSTYFFILMALKGFTPFLMGALRFLIAGILMLGWCLIKGEKLFVIKDIKHAAISGLLMLFGGTGVVIWVEQVLPSAFVAILVSSAPIWFVLMDKPQWKATFSNRSAMSGLIIGFIGIVLLFGEKVSTLFYGSGNHAEIVAMLLLMFGSLCWTAGSLYSKYRPSSGSNTVNVGWQMLIAGIAFLPGFFWREASNVNWKSISIDAWLSLLYLIFFGSIAAYTAYIWLLKVRPSAQVSTYAYVNPVVAVLLGVIFGGEIISFAQIFGLIIILASVLMINLAKYSASKKTVVP